MLMSLVKEQCKKKLSFKVDMKKKSEDAHKEKMSDKREFLSFVPF